MKHNTKTMVKRWLALVLCLCMICPSGVAFATAAEELPKAAAYTGGLCEHHPEHTEDCGYVEAVEGQPCNHVHDENCGYQEPTEEIPCAHVHDDSCGYQAAVEEIPCDKGCTDTDENGNIIHQEGCAYRPAVAEQPCTHTHDNACGYQAATEGSPCAHVHDENCGYVETVVGQPCTFVCEFCSGEKEEQDLLSEEGEVTISMANPVGYPNVEYNLLEKATVSPEQDADGNEIKLRVKKLEANPTNVQYDWDESSVLKVTENKNVVFTVTYEAYVEVEDAQEGQESVQVLATQDVTFTVQPAGEIGDRLDGDYAYISDAYLVKDETTESKLAIRTGTAPFDENDNDGNDSSATNNTVRSFDVVTYTAAFKTQVRDGGPYTAYKTGTVYYEFVVEGTKNQVRYETDSMSWLTAKTEGKFTITEEEHSGKTYQVLRGSFLAEPSDGNPTAIGNSYQELNIALRVLAMTQGDTVKPQFTFWLEGNDVPEDRLVTGSDYSCAEHDEQEYKTITAPDVSVTSAPRYNVKIVSGNTSVNQALGTFDFSTGNDLAQNKSAGEVNGRIHGFGVVIQIAGKSPQHGLRGCELPNGSPITFDLSLSSEFLGDDGKKATDVGYSPLLWSLDGNGSNQQSDGRSLDMVTGKTVYNIPTNIIEGTSGYLGCAKGGTWTGTQDESTIHVTVSDYAVDLTKLPYSYYGGGNATYIYYNPNNISGYWDIQYACFSAGEIWVVQPFYDKDKNYIVDKYGNGSFNLTVEDQNLKMTGESDTALDEVEDNSNQAIQTDDQVVQTSYLAKSGVIAAGVSYRNPNNTNAPLTEGCANNGKDWTLFGNSLAIQGGINHSAAEGLNVGVAYDYLIKFDDAFFSIEQATGTADCKFLYGAKTDKSGWNHQDKRPDEEGYDDEMMQATADDLIFFSSLEELRQEGYVCVAVLNEARSVRNVTTSLTETRILGNMKSDTQLVGNVFMITHSAKAWNKADIQDAVAKCVNKDASSLTDADYNTYVQSDDFPSRADKDTPLNYAEDYPASFWTYDYDSANALKNYIKSQYDVNGYVTGSSGTAAGDSCLVVDYATQITKSPNQPGTDEGGKKLTYDMDTSQREVDYVLYPTAIRSSGESTTEGTSTTTTVYVEDTLPVGLEYIINSAYYGGEYTSNGGGKAGTITGGQELYPTVTKNDDGTTTLLFMLEDVTITADEVTQFEPIYYSCTIGTPGNEETDVVNQQQLVNSVKIWSDDEQIRDFVATNGNYAEQSIIISKNRAVSFSKTSDQKIVEVGEEMGFTIHHGNNSSNSMAVVDIDFLPYNGDGKGTQITGQVIVSELTVQSLAENFKLYYTTDKNKQGTSAAEYEASDFTKDNGWTEMTVDAETGIVTLPDVENVIVAVAAVGTLPANQTLKMHITFEVPGGKPGEFLVNSFCYDDMESNARTYIVNRLLEGVVWLDENKDGLRDNEEELLDGVKVTLLKKGEDGNYAPYLLDGKAVSVETGKQINVLTGEVKDHVDGTYGFLHLPQGDFAVQFEDGETAKISDYTATQANVGNNDTIDSDAIANVQDGKLVSASIEGIEMPEAKQITVQTYESRHHDLGLHTSEPETQPINIPVKKVWNDNNDQDGKRPDKITVELLINGSESGTTLELDEANGWQGTFEGLDQNDDEGNEITYAIEEVKVDGYETSITGDATTGFTITNTHTPETTEVSGSKTWEDADNQDGKRPTSITIRLLANGEQVQVKTVTANDGWKWSFTDLPKYAGGNEITYTISEDAVPGYTSDVDGFNVTNSYTPGKTNVTVTKSWKDSGNQDGLRPAEITVELLENGEPTGKTLKLSKGTRWMGTFSDLDEYKDGEKIVYSVKEVSVKGYDSSVTGNATTGFVITNSHTPAKIDLSGSKTWDDADNQDGKRPESITIRLYANGKQVEVVTVTAEDGWKWSFANLPKYESGSEIRYTITEDAVPGYQSEVNGMDVTNHYTPGKINIPVTKNWQDKNDADGIRPDSITVKLYADGKDTGKELVLDQENNWTASFDNLDEYADGVKISYTIAEVEVDGYDTSISGSAETGFVINNSHTPDTPDEPDDPDDPDEPGKPTDPDDPDEPTTPTEPDEPDKPNPPKDDTPQTGDTTNLALWIGLLAISATGFTATLVLGKKKRYRGKHMR